MIYIKISFYSQKCYLSCLKMEGEGDYTADTISHCCRTMKITITLTVCIVDIKNTQCLYFEWIFKSSGRWKMKCNSINSCNLLQLRCITIIL